MTSPCPNGLICAQMGLTTGRCLNYGICHSISRSVGSDQDSPPVMPSPSNALSHSNPNLFRSRYRNINPCWNVTTVDDEFGEFWEVGSERNQPLEAGYAIAELLPMRPIPGGGREVCRFIEGFYCPAEWNSHFKFDLSGDPIVLVEWLDAKVKTIWTIYDGVIGKHLVTQCKDGTLLIEPDDAENDPIKYSYWCSPLIAAPTSFGDEAERVEFPSGEALNKLLKQVETATFVDMTAFCHVCGDHTSDANYIASECGHIRYSEQLSSWAGCGYGEENFDDSYGESFANLAQRLREDPFYPDETIESLTELLKTRDHSAIWRFTDHYAGNDDVEAALTYLDSLNEDVGEPIIQKVIKWLNA